LSEVRMDTFRPGDEVYVRLVFQNVVSLKNAFVFFVHEQDENEHIMIGFASRDDEKPAVRPGIQTIMDFSATIKPNQKPGVYALDRINFETFGGQTLDHRGDVGTPRFRVEPEPEFAPIMENVSIFTESMWRTVKKREDW
jgi:hypothetical protein